MTVKLKGKIKRIQEAEIYGSFEKRVFWLEEQDVQYPNTYNLECHQGDGNLLDNFHPDQMVECDVDIRGRHWKKDDREGVINTLKCWRIRSLEGPVNTNPVTPSTEPQSPTHQPTANPIDPIDEPDDLPF